MSVNNRHCEIAVVGGGPVGAATALALRSEGFDVLLVERGTAPPPVPPTGYDARVYAIAPASQQFLDALAVWPEIVSARVSPYSTMQVWERDPAQGLRFRAADSGRAELGWIIEHRLIAAALWARLDARTCLTQTTIADVEFREDGARLTMSDGAGIDARLVIAADGADSQMRSLAGIETVAWRYPQRAIVCHVRTSRPHRGTAYQRFLRSGPLAFLPLADGRCSIVWSAEEPLAAELLALDEAAFCARLSEASEGALGPVLEASARTGVQLQLLHAAEYTAASLVLVGDAAHAIHPLAGQGVNLGFADAQALVATLAEARDAGRDWSAPRTLARYARARKSQNLEMLALTDGLYRAFSQRLPGARALLGLGLDAVDHLGPIKAWLSHRATHSPA